MIVTRFAPSPTGFLHIGGLRTALFSYLWARKNNGKFLLRIEDTDLARNSGEATAAILEAFKWARMEHDGAIEYQSKRFAIYKEHIDKLLASGAAYKCYMTKEELDALREEQAKRGERPRYDGRYRDGKLPPREGVEPAIRIKAPTEGAIAIDDGVKGRVEFDWAEVDDFVIARSDGTPTYNFVVAVDDALMGVTDVIRGDDHLSNTPKQIAVYRAFGWTPPKFFHVPMILNGEGKKLSKRDGATDVMEYKKMGYLPDALLNFLVRLGWSHKDQEIFTISEMKSLFDPSHINKSASAYNALKLAWINHEHIKAAADADLIALLAEFGADLTTFDRASELIALCKEKSQTLNLMAIEANKILRRPQDFSDLAIVNAEAIALIEEFLNHPHIKMCKKAADFQVGIDHFLSAKNIKMPQFAKPFRVALFGAAQGASLSDAIAILGLGEAKERVNILKEKVGR
ncbi:MAG: glutamate--tRNA ligase [Helicobacteraceae bacterium]|jgi:glutamyl-tRNA synthetase|nr:glutamate--tRNA ligase [Helicobacteraceae bacterium]